MDTDRNLLFGVLCLQMDLLDSRRFAEGCAAWAARKDLPLADLLVERGWISPEERADVERCLARKVKKHEGDVRASLAEVARADVCRALAVLADPAIEQSLAAVTRDDAGQVVLSSQPGGQEEGGRYARLREYARGGIGVVWEARDRQLGRVVALKELRPEYDTAAGHSRFLAEAQITGQLAHPGIVPVYDQARSPDGSPFYTMRLIQGRTLSEAVREHHKKRRAGEATRAQLHELLQAFVMVCNTVAFAHSRGVVHRDLKGANIILGPYGEVLVLDWGLACRRGAGEAAPAVQPVELTTGVGSHATQAGQVLGTPGYMAPEQAEGRPDLIDARSDVYGLGAVLYEILTGNPPFRGGQEGDVLRRVREGLLTPPRAVVPEVPRPLEAVCLKALAREREGRYPGALELAEEVKRWLAGEPVRACPEPLARRALRWARRHRTLTSSALTALAVAVLLGLAGWGWREREREERFRKEEERAVRVLAEVERAEELLKQAREAPRERWEGLVVESATAARRARDLLAGEEAGEALGRRLRAATEEVEGEDRDRRLLARLEEAQLSSLTQKEGGRDPVRREREYSRAFAEYGLDLEKVPVEEVAARLRARTIRGELAAVLDDWGSLHGEGGDKVYRPLARRVDDDPLRRRIRESLASKDRAALDEMGKAENLGSVPALTLVTLADSLRELGRADKAEAVLRAAWVRFPDHYLVNVKLGFHLFARKRFAEAGSYFAVAAGLARNNPMPWACVGGCLSNQGRFEEAIPILRRATEVGPTSAVAWEVLGLALEIQDREEALPALLKAVELDPEGFSSFETLGDVYTRRRQLREAEAAYRKAIGLAPEKYDTHFKLVLALLSQARFADALRVAEVCERHDKARRPAWLQTRRQIQAVLRFDADLPAFLCRKAEPADLDERVVLAQVCFWRGYRLASARFLGEALAQGFGGVLTCQGPDRKFSLVYDAACAAALASSGQTREEVGEAKRSRWRTQALHWLRLCLKEYARQRDDPRAAEAIRRGLRDWQTNPYLAGVRGAETLARFTPAERADWESFWSEVEWLKKRPAGPE